MRSFTVATIFLVCTFTFSLFTFCNFINMYNSKDDNFITDPYIFTNDKTFTIPKGKFTMSDKIRYARCLQTSFSCGLTEKKSIPSMVIPHHYIHLTDDNPIHYMVSQLLPVKNLQSILFHLLCSFTHTYIQKK